MLPLITAEVRAVTDATLRFTPSGMAVAEFRAAANSRKKDDETGEWKDDKVCWLTVTAFKKLAENVGESVLKGRLVNVTGKLQTEDWEDKEGNKRQTYRVIADTVSLSLAFTPAKPIGTTEGGSVQRVAAGSGEPDPFAAPAQDSEPPF